MTDRELDDRLVESLLALHHEPLDPNLVAAWVDGVLEREERELVAARIAADPEAQLLVRSLRDERRRGRVLTLRFAAVAALVLLGFGLWWSRRSPAPDLATRLAAESARLARLDPALFDGFVPYDAQALADDRDVERASGTWRWPRGVLLDAPRELRWKNPLGASRASVSIDGDGFAWSREVEGESIEAPTLAPGRYVVRYRGLDTLAAQELRRVFVVADEATRAKHRRALATIAETAPVDLAALLAAHYAIRHRLLAEARDAVTRIPRDTAARREAAAELDAHLTALAGAAR